MQNFKDRYRQIEDAIKNVSSLNECKEVEVDIENFANDRIQSSFRQSIVPG